MSIFRFFVFVIVLGVTNVVSSQGLNSGSFIKNNVSLTVGYDRTYFKDINFSPLQYKSNGFNINLNYWRQTKSENHAYFKINFAPTVLKTDISDALNTSNYQVNLELGYLKNIFGTNKEVNLFLGGGYHSFINIALYNEGDAITFFALHGLDAAAMFSYEFDYKNSFKTTLSIPVFGLLVRPPYTGWDKEIVDNQDKPIPIVFKGNWTSFNNFFAINSCSVYTYALSSIWDIVAKYQFKYYTTSQLSKVVIVTNQISVGANFKF